MAGIDGVGGAGARVGIAGELVAGVGSCCFVAAVRFFADDGMVVRNMGSRYSWGCMVKSKNVADTTQKLGVGLR